MPWITLALFWLGTLMVGLLAGAWSPVIGVSIAYVLAGGVWLEMRVQAR